MSEIVEAVQAPPKSRFVDCELNRLVSDPLKVPELKDGESAIYKLIMSDFKDSSRQDQNGNAKNCSPGRSMYHSREIYDPVNKRKVTIRNITSYKLVTMPGGEEKKTPILGRFIFPKTGIKSVDYTQQDTYAWMERHPYNRDNPFREKTKTPTFYRVNPVKEAIKAMENDIVLTDALLYVRDAKIQSLKSMYENLSKSAKMGIDASAPETLRRGIFNYAKINPILAMKAVNSKEAREIKLKIQIMEAEHFNIIMFQEAYDDGGKRKWCFVNGEFTDICEVDVAVHKIDGLIEHLKTNRKTYEIIINKLQNVLNPRR